MAKKGKGYFNEALLKQRRTRTRAELVGTDGVNAQDKRMRKAKKSGNPKKVTLEYQKRMKEYKARKVTVIDKVKRYKNPENK